MTDTEPHEPAVRHEDEGASVQEATEGKALEAQAPALGGRQVSDTIGTGSGCAIGCTMLTIAIVAIGILVFFITR